MTRRPTTTIHALCALATVALLGCQPRIGPAEALTAESPACRFEPLAPGLEDDAELRLQAHGRLLGILNATPRAMRYTDKVTSDGYSVRSFAGTLVLGLGLLGIGALIAALLLTFGLTFGPKRPRSRWPERMAQAIATEVNQIRALNKAKDALLTAIIARFDTLLGSASSRAETLLKQATPLLVSADSATSTAKLDLLERQLASILAQLEHLHLHLLAWQERQHDADRAALEAQMATVVNELGAAVQAAQEAA